MGYRSKGLIAIAGPHERMLTEIASLNLTGGEHVVSALKEMVLAPLFPMQAEKLLSLVYTYEDLKWYPDYTDVTAFTIIWQHFVGVTGDDDDDDIQIFSGAFIRIGEDDDDLETENFGDLGHDLGYVYRSYECEACTDPTKDIRHNRTSLDDMKKTP